MLNAIQALIFSVLTLIFITLAIESHHEEEGHIAEDVLAEIQGRSRRSSSPPTDRRAQRRRPVDEPGPSCPGTGGTSRMEHIGAGLAALGVIGPGIGIGILAGLSATAIGRNPDAAGQIRGIAIILAAFAEGLGVLAIVVGLLAIFIK